MPHYMAELIIKDRPVLLIGGGRVAQRKLHGLLMCGARITVVAPVLAASMEQHVKNGEIVHFPSRFYPEILVRTPRPLLVFAVTDSAQENGEIARLCQEHGLLCNSADGPTVSGFLVPAVVRRGPVMVGVGTEGQSPALSRLLKERMDRWLEPGWGAIAELFGAWRPEVKDQIKKSARRQVFWREVCLAVEQQDRVAENDNEPWLRRILHEFDKS